MNSDDGKKKTHICLCLGSSCYSRGNRDNLERVQDILEEHPEASITLEGCHCQGNCGNGPNITMNDEQLSSMTPELFETYIKDIVSTGDAE